MNKSHSQKGTQELSKFGASYYAGLTIEADPDSTPPKLTIDGQKIEIKKVDKAFVYSDGAYNNTTTTLSDLAKWIIDTLWDRKKREKLRRAHIAKLGKDCESWNRWRRDHPEIRPMLFGAPLTGRNLAGFNFCNANLIEADLRGAMLTKANFHEANLGGARLNGAKLMYANFCRTDLYETDLSKPRLTQANIRNARTDPTNLTGANLQGTQLARTDFTGAILNKCTIYGLSAWNLRIEKAKQKKLKILYRVQQANGEWDEGDFVVNDLEVAQFVFLLLDNTRINNFFNTMTEKAVVIMGRFVPKARMAILDGLRRDLRKEGFLPIVFDFDKPKDRDLTETIKTLVGLCRFAIVDITKPKSTPYELAATVQNYQVPFVPIIQKGQEAFSMFKDLYKYDWMLGKLIYTPDTLSRVTKPLIIKRALKEYERIRRFKARPEPKVISAEEFLAREQQKLPDANQS